MPQRPLLTPRAHRLPERNRRPQRPGRQMGRPSRSQTATRTASSSKRRAISVGHRSKATPAPHPLWECNLAPALVHTSLTALTVDNNHLGSRSEQQHERQQRLPKQAILAPSAHPPRRNGDPPATPPTKTDGCRGRPQNKQTNKLTKAKQTKPNGQTNKPQNTTKHNKTYLRAKQMTHLYTSVHKRP